MNRKNNFPASFEIITLLLVAWYLGIWISTIEIVWDTWEFLSVILEIEWTSHLEPYGPLEGWKNLLWELCRFYHSASLGALKLPKWHAISWDQGLWGAIGHSEFPRSVLGGLGDHFRNCIWGIFVSLRLHYIANDRVLTSELSDLSGSTAIWFGASSFGLLCHSGFHEIVEML